MTNYDITIPVEKPARDNFVPEMGARVRLKTSLTRPALLLSIDRRSCAASIYLSIREATKLRDSLTKMLEDNSA